VCLLLRIENAVDGGQGQPLAALVERATIGRRGVLVSLPIAGGGRCRLTNVDGYVRLPGRLHGLSCLAGCTGSWRGESPAVAGRTASGRRGSCDLVFERRWRRQSQPVGSSRR
jgi:hypothetical protein